MVAQAGCVWSDLVRDDPAIAVVKSTATRIYFVKDDVLASGCPNDTKRCLGPAYLTAGNVVLTGPTQGRYICAGFVGARGATTIGWLPSTAIAPSPDASPAMIDWTGHWIAPEQDVTITSAAEGTVSIKGEATWGMDDPDRRNRGGVHTGEIAGTIRPSNGVVAFTMGDDGTTLPYDAADEFTCRVRMVRRGPYLVIRDNNACGGVNVTFSGFYRREL